MTAPPRTQTYYNEAGFLQLMKKVSEHGEDEKNDRTGVGTKFTYGETVVYEMYGPTIPMMTTRHVGFQTVLDELLFFLRGDTDTTKLKSKIWEGNTTRQFLDDRGLPQYQVGEMGPMYGWVWRNAGADYVDAHTDYKNADGRIDQIDQLLSGLLNKPSGRRHMLTAWVPSYLSQGVLEPKNSTANLRNCEKCKNVRVPGKVWCVEFRKNKMFNIKEKVWQLLSHTPCLL